MDPNVQLDEIRSLCEDIERASDSGAVALLAERLAERVTELDEWLGERRGFLPSRWSKCR